MEDNIIEETLENGLQVRLKQICSAPIISHWVWYKVGSRNEKPGLTGISHWVEHMQFKGTPRFTPGVLDKAISRDGGYWNAFTYLDWTAYFETMPAEKIDISLDLESDRKANRPFDESEVESERSVIISEREGSENEPVFRLSEAVQKASFYQHPYRHEIIGEKEDLHSIRRGDLFDHYQKNYIPNNALVAVAGDMDIKKMLRMVKKYYGDIPAGKPVENKILQETSKPGNHYLEITGPGQTTFIQAAYRSPSANNEDFFTFTVLDSLLTGPTSLNMFGGGGISNKTSRLYRSLVEKELAVSVGGGLGATIDPYLYDISITMHPKASIPDVIRAFETQIDVVCSKLVSTDEISRAIKQARAMFAYGSENITNQALWLGYAEMFADYKWFIQYLDRLASVTPEDLKVVAEKYLQPENRVIGVYIPDGNLGENE